MLCPRCQSQHVAQARFCVVCGAALLPVAPPPSGVEPAVGPTVRLSAPPEPSAPQTPPLVQQIYIQQIYTQQPVVVMSPPEKPGYIQAIGVMCLIDGILNLGWGVGLISTICFAPLGLYAFALGIFEIVHSTKLLSNPITAKEPNKVLAWMQIANVLTGDIISLTIGILSLVFYNDPKVQRYFEYAARQ
jgi:hypothetical protein